jgi:hypothetical protein
MTVEGSLRKIIAEPGLERKLDGQDPKVDVETYTIQIPHSFEEYSFFFLFDEITRDDGEESLESTFIASTPENLTPKRVLSVNTLYKRKADKVRPVNLGVSTGEAPAGDDN